jgi:1-acyl-sn-glycerol-3-phosphate acyltransferase
MDFAVILLRKIWKGLFFANAFITMVLLFPFFYILLSKKKWFPKAMELKRFWAHLLLLDVGIFYSVEQSTPLDPAKSYVFCPNHSSYLDIVVSYVALPNYFHFIGKAELKKVPLFKIFFKDMDITVDRKSIRDSHRAMTRAAEDLKEGISIAILDPLPTIVMNEDNIEELKDKVFTAIENCLKQAWPKEMTA